MYADYRGAGNVSYWRSQSGYEVDFILNDTTAIEVKSSRTVGTQDLKNLKALREEGKLKHYIIVSLEEHPRISEGIRILPWKKFLADLWDGEFA